MDFCSYMKTSSVLCLVSANNCALEKVSPSVAEELSFEVSFSETIVIDDKEKEKQKKQRIKKDDCILPVSSNTRMTK